MLKARGTAANGQPLLILGLSRANTEALLKGLPIHIDTAADLEMPGGPQILIMGGETEQDIHNELSTYLTLPEPQLDPNDVSNRH